MRKRAAPPISRRCWPCSQFVASHTSWRLAGPHGRGEFWGYPEVDGAEFRRCRVDGVGSQPRIGWPIEVRSYGRVRGLVGASYVPFWQMFLLSAPVNPPEPGAANGENVNSGFVFFCVGTRNLGGFFGVSPRSRTGRCRDSRSRQLWGPASLRCRLRRCICGYQPLGLAQGVLILGARPGRMLLCTFPGSSQFCLGRFSRLCPPNPPGLSALGSPHKPSCWGPRERSTGLPFDRKCLSKQGLQAIDSSEDSHCGRYPLATWAQPNLSRAGFSATDLLTLRSGMPLSGPSVTHRKR